MVTYYVINVLIYLEKEDVGSLISWFIFKCNNCLENEYENI